MAAWGKIVIERWHVGAGSGFTGPHRVVVYSNSHGLGGVPAFEDVGLPVVAAAVIEFVIELRLWRGDGFGELTIRGMPEHLWGDDGLPLEWEALVAKCRSLA